MYELIKKDGRAKRGRLTTVHGVIETPVFMNVGTVAAIKGAVSTDDLKDIGTQVELSNTYHLHVRTGDKLIKEFGGLHKFMHWDRPILTDSGGFQVFSLAKLRKIKEEGVSFASHIDGRKIFMGPEESMQIQSNLGSTIAMAFDECPPHPATREYMQNSVDRTTRWLRRCKKEMDRLNSLEDTVNPHQMLFGINQGGTFEDIRIEHAKEISKMDLDGYALGGLAVGETHEEMYNILEKTVPYLPEDKPTYLMGVGTPVNILEAVDRGVDFFDCVYPTADTTEETNELYAPMKGEVLDVVKSADPAFASKAMGEGVAINPSEGIVYAPADGTISLIFPTKHAMGITLNSGVELLIHAGIDTVKMNGEGFETFVETGAKVKKGDKLLSFDMDLVKEKGYKTQTMFLVADAKGKEVEVVEVADADNNTKIMNLK